MDLIAIIRNNSTFSYKKIYMDNSLERSLSDHFESLLASFLSNKDFLPLDILYKPERNELFQIPDFELDSTISDALSSSASLPSFTLDLHAEVTVGLMTKLTHLGQSFILFQSFDSRKLLSRKLIAWQTTNTFNKMSSPAFVLGNSLTSVYNIGRSALFFRSYFMANRFLNLESLMVEATSSEIDSFFKSPLWIVQDGLNQNELSSTNKKLIKAAILNKITDKTVFYINDIAQKFNVEVTLNEDKSKIVLPLGSKFTQLLRFFSEHYLISPMTGNTYYTNSRRIN